MFSYWKRGKALLKTAQDLCARQQRAIEQLETENLQLLGQVFQLMNPSTRGANTMKLDFEAWATAQHLNTETFNGHYISKITQGFWECWQAARK